MVYRLHLPGYIEYMQLSILCQLVSPTMLQGCYRMFPHTNHESIHACVMHAHRHDHMHCCMDSMDMLMPGHKS